MTNRGEVAVDESTAVRKQAVSLARRHAGVDLGSTMLHHGLAFLTSQEGTQKPLAGLERFRRKNRMK